MTNVALIFMLDLNTIDNIILIIIKLVAGLKSMLAIVEVYSMIKFATIYAHLLIILVIIVVIIWRKTMFVVACIFRISILSIMNIKISRVNSHIDS